VRGALAGKQVGSYLIEKLIGEGGMGEVYLARHSTLDRQAAVKVLSGRFSSDHEWLVRFRREAKILARLDHPNAVRVYDYGQAHGREYLVMEYIDGNDLSQVLKKRGKMRVSDALAITKRVCNALAEAHALGVVHRDIKPGNILITREKVKVVDFGLSRALAAEHNTTQPGRILGTPNYMSPEQCLGQPIDARCDLYSLGATLYHMLSGELPHSAEMPLAVLRMHSDEKVLPKPLTEHDPTIPAAVEALVRKLMSKRPEGRYATAREAAVAIDQILRSVRSGDSVRMARPKAGTVPWLLYICVAAAVVVGLFMAVWLNRAAPEEAPEPKKPVKQKKLQKTEKRPTRRGADELRKSLQHVRQMAIEQPEELKLIDARLTEIAREFGERVSKDDLRKIRVTAREGALRSRAESYYRHATKGKWEQAVDFVDPGVLRNSTRVKYVARLRRLVERGKRLGWTVVKRWVKRVDASRDDGWVEIGVLSRHTRGTTDEKLHRDRWLLIDYTWYIVHSRPRRR